MPGTRSPYKGRNSFKTKSKFRKGQEKPKKGKSNWAMEERTSLVSLFDVPMDKLLKF